MSLFNKKNLDLDNKNRYNISKKDMIDKLKGFPLGLVVRMLEETEAQGNKPDVKLFQERNVFDKSVGGFDWDKTEKGIHFWSKVIKNKNFNLFFEKYPEYEKYN